MLAPAVLIGLELCHPMAVLVAFGWQLQAAHAAPHRPIAFALLIVAAGWLWFSRTRRAAAAPQ